MKLRGRLVLTTAALSLPVMLGLSWFSFSGRRQALLESMYETTVQRMEAGGRERCEAAPARFGRRGRGPRRGPRARQWRGQRVFDERYASSDGAGAALHTELAHELRDGAPVAARWTDRRAEIAMRMPWDGPCAILVVERPVGPELGWGGFLRSSARGALVALLTAIAALLALGPVVRRIRRLTESVRAQATGGYEADVEVRGADEVAELARAFNEASAEIRRRLVELGDRDRALTEFLASTTHDVMIPLTVLQGHLSDLERSTSADGTADPAVVAGALEEAHYLTALLRNLSAAARMDAGEPMITRHPFDLREVIERVVSRHATLARQLGVTLDHAVPEAAVPVHADSTLAEQAFGNLVSNAIRYNQRGGHVAVVLERREGRFAARVLDDGPGIPEEELARVAERRFRGGEARRRRPTGLGLGLHIVRDVAQQHGWELRFEAPEEGGLCVRVEGELSASALSSSAPPERSEAAQT